MSRVRKSHRCYWCGHKIRTGSTCHISTQVDRGRGWVTFHSHPVCEAAAQRPGSGIDGGQSSYATEAYLYECHDEWEFCREVLGLPLLKGVDE